MFHDCNFCLGLDNWYTSPLLFTHLQRLRIHAVGTAKQNVRGLPKKFLFGRKGANKKERGDMLTATTVVPDVHDAKLHVTSWQDNRPVTIVSTFRGKQTIVSRNTKEKSGAFKKIEITQPTVVKTYNYAMGGTDKMDQLVSYYLTMIRTRNWQHRIFTHFLTVAVVNAHILYKTKFPGAATEFAILKDFIIGVCKEWGIPASVRHADEQPSKRRKGMSSIPAEVRLHGRHSPRMLPQPSESYPAKKSRRDLRRKCALEGCGKKASFECMECDVGLCIAKLAPNAPAISCWEVFHSSEGRFG